MQDMIEGEKLSFCGLYDLKQDFSAKEKEPILANSNRKDNESWLHRPHKVIAASAIHTLI